MGVVISLNEGRSSKSQIDTLISLVEQDMLRVNDLILQRAGSRVDLIPKLTDHLVSSGGKRLRPMLTIASAQMCGYEGKWHVNLAAAVEFMHTATLLHDDVVDESDLRRGKPAPRMIWGNQASVLVGDYLLGQAFQMMVETESLAALQILSKASATIAEGEVMQLVAAQNVTTTEDEYLTVIGAKTAALFTAATEVGAVIAETSDEQRSALRSFGNNLGIAFQLVDDALDYSGEQAKLGKSVGDDFREGKITLPVVLSYRRGNEDERQFWRSAMQNGENSDENLQIAMQYMLDHSAISDTLERAAHYGSIASDALAIFPESDFKSALQETVRFCIERAH